MCTVLEGEYFKRNADTKIPQPQRTIENLHMIFDFSFPFQSIVPIFCRTTKHNLWAKHAAR